MLAGGLGTRLGSVTQSRPKPMVEISGIPFLRYLLDYLEAEGVRRVVLAVSYQWEMISAYFGDHYGGMELFYSVEEVPLGTGGGLRQALTYTVCDVIFVLNGDTYFAVSLDKLLAAHRVQGRQMTLSLKSMPDVARYGAVKLWEGRVIGFEEKGSHRKGYINGGVLVLNRSVLDELSVPASFSLERDVLMSRNSDLNIGGFVSDAYFIDIGVPEDLERARRELCSVSTGSRTKPEPLLPVKVDPAGGKRGRTAGRDER